MECSKSRLSDEKRARDALDNMSDEALATMISMMEEIARQNPRGSRPALKIVKNPSDLPSGE